MFTPLLVVYIVIFLIRSFDLDRLALLPRAAHALVGCWTAALPLMRL